MIQTAVVKFYCFLIYCSCLLTFVVCNNFGIIHSCHKQLSYEAIMNFKHTVSFIYNTNFFIKENLLKKLCIIYLC